MSSPKITEGEIPFDTPNAGKECKTWYKIFGDLSTGKRPLIIIHGGPDMLPVRALATQYQTPVIFYDQLGTGNSTHLADHANPAAFFTPDLFMRELLNLLSHLRITSYDLLGQSWGGMLGAQFAATYQPPGLNRLIISNSPASMELWAECCDRLRAQLPMEVQETLSRCEREGRIDSVEYEEATREFYKRHLCRVDPFPEDVQATFQIMMKDPTVYHTMNGPTEFHVVGTLKTWSMIADAHKIKVPTLLINGRYDEAQDSCVEPFFREIEKVKWVRMEESSHLPMWDESERYLDLVAGFLDLH